MKSIRMILIAAACALAGLFLGGCNQQVETTGLPPDATNAPSAESTTQTTTTITAPAATNEPTAQSTTQTTATITTPAPINNPPDSSVAITSSTAAASLPLPVSALATSTNELPTAAPLPVTQQ